MSTTGHESWKDQAEQAAAGAAPPGKTPPTPDPDKVNPPATASGTDSSTTDKGGSQDIPAFNKATEQARSAAAEAHEAAGKASSAAQDARVEAARAEGARAERARTEGTAPEAAPAATTHTTATDKTERIPVETAPMRAMKLGMAVSSPGGKFLFGLTRILLGWIFLWAFLDKLFGLGKSTASSNAWVNGGSPTTGYLNNVGGPFNGFFNPMAGQTWADWAFMIALAGAGVALILGIGMWIASIGGAILLVFMWMASLPIISNPFLDEHLIYAVVLLGLAFIRGGDFLGIGKWWGKSALVRTLPFLRLSRANPWRDRSTRTGPAFPTK